MTEKPDSKATPAAPVNVQALKALMKALLPTSHQLPLEPLLK